ncbi:gibberellin-regulated protein 14-like [Cannabis sativa]|uniref:gibberellin-regulated protein 14-like n=1 Tax=Cannabis sativa TaxID=3483 RepID=UPI0029C9D1BD|nr:gibberellin-regulated protein 14-like [Cannabis sativa]
MARTRRPPIAAPSDVDNSTVPVVPPPSDPPVSVVDHVTVDSTTAPVVHPPPAAPMEHARTGSRPRSTVIDDSTTVPAVSPHVQEPASPPPTAPVSSPSQHVRAASAIPPPVIPSRFIPPMTNGNAPSTHSVIPNTNH